jgi:lysozyme
MHELVEQLTKQLDREEGRVKHAYQDHLGYWTIGVGRLIDRRKGGGLRDKEIDYLLANDIEEKKHEVETTLPWFNKLNPARQGVLISMAFQMGINGLLNFKNTLKMVEAGNYDGAATGMLNSLWAKQTPGRAQRMAKQMRTGEWV